MTIMVFNRRRRSKVKWEKQVTKARKETKDQFDRLANDTPSAVSDLSETLYTNGSEVDAIGLFGKNNDYNQQVGDSFTLGATTADFDAIADYNPATGSPYNINQFAEESTYDQNTYDDSGHGQNYFPIQNDISRVTDELQTNESGLTGERWGEQGSYRVQGLDNVSDVVGNSFSQSQQQHPMPKSQSINEKGTGPTFTATMESPEELDGDDTVDSPPSYSYLEDYDIPRPVRQSPIVVLYDTILSHPLLTCVCLPCIPCLAIYVKTSDRPSSAQPRRMRKGKSKLKSGGSRDDSMFAEYNANRNRFDDISVEVELEEERGDVDTPRKQKEGRNLRHRVGSITSRGSDFSGIQSKEIRKTRGRPWSKGKQSRDTNIISSRIQSDGRPDSRGLSSHGQTEFSNIVSQQGGYKQGGYNSVDGGDPIYDPRNPYDNMVDTQYSLGDGNGMDTANNLVNVPQGEWNYDSVGGSSRRSVGWKHDDQIQVHPHQIHPHQVHPQYPTNDSLDQRGVNGEYWQNSPGTGTFSSYDQGSFNHRGNGYSRQLGGQSGTTYSNQLGAWNQGATESFSAKGSGQLIHQYAGDHRVLNAMGPIDESTYESEMRRGGAYYRQ